MAAVTYLNEAATDQYDSAVFDYIHGIRGHNTHIGRKPLDKVMN